MHILAWIASHLSDEPFRAGNALSVGKITASFDPTILGAGRRAAVGSPPVVTLPDKRHDQGVPETIIVRRGVSWNADFDFGLGYVQPESSMQPIPPGEHHTVIGVGFRLYLRMMDAMHSWCDEHTVQAAFQGNGQAQIAVVEKGMGLKHEFVSGEDHEGHADHADLEDADGGSRLNRIASEYQASGQAVAARFMRATPSGLPTTTIPSPGSSTSVARGEVICLP